ncbi:Uncharacterised protein [Salmonella enterica subsp. enterica serovar Bovismorbificans]|nr:Uncharacterised protein [Salmonella enterica subsp. enterica serovar Bovismorbificans]
MNNSILIIFSNFTIWPIKFQAITVKRDMTASNHDCRYFIGN